MRGKTREVPYAQLVIPVLVQEVAWIGNHGHSWTTNRLMEVYFLSRADAIQHAFVVDILCLEAFECTVEKLVHEDIVNLIEPFNV